ncbi:MAG: lipoate protein ligase C-terminal domain-containing protein [Candidatus Methanofastidiosia archaeon]
MRWKRLKESRQKIARERIDYLFKLAYRVFELYPERSRRYVEIARNISKKHKVGIPPHYKRMFCKKCGSLFVPGKNVTIRTRGSKVVMTCGECKTIKRYPFLKEKREKKKIKKYFAELKTMGGLICIDLAACEDRITNIRITGDFFMYPEEKLSILEAKLEGKRFVEIEKVIDDFYKIENITTPGIFPGDFLRALLKAKYFP